MFSSAETNTLSTKLASYFCIFWRIGISSNINLADFVSPFHNLAKVTSKTWFYSWNFTKHYFTGRTVKAYPITLFHNSVTNLEGSFLIVDFDIATTRNTAFTPTASNNCCVRSHTAALSENTFCGIHTSNIFWRGFNTNENYFFAFGFPFACVFSAENDTATASSWRSSKTLCQNFLWSFGVKNGV